MMSVEYPLSSPAVLLNGLDSVRLLGAGDLLGMCSTCLLHIETACNTGSVGWFLIALPGRFFSHSESSE